MARIVIVEDQRIIARDVEQRLRRLGHAVCGVAASGQAAIALVADTRPDVVLMDLRLEGAMSGVEAGIEISRRFGTPLIFTTGESWDPATHGLPADKTRYLTKPYHTAELQRAIGSLRPDLPAVARG